MSAEPTRSAVFAYGSLVNTRGVAQMLGREIRGSEPVRLEGWCRRWSLKRNNLEIEKTFARHDNGQKPAWILSLNVERVEGSLEPASRAAPNGVLLPASAEDLERFDSREHRYDRVEVTEQIRPAEGPGRDSAEESGRRDRLEAFDRVYTYSAKPENLAPRPPTDSIVLRSYYDAVQSAFAELGGAELANYVTTTEPPGVEIAAGVLVADAITAGNPRDW